VHQACFRGNNLAVLVTHVTAKTHLYGSFSFANSSSIRNWFQQPAEAKDTPVAAGFLLSGNKIKTILEINSLPNSIHLTHLTVLVGRGFCDYLAVDSRRRFALALVFQTEFT
jgi:hypothetical protein